MCLLCNYQPAVELWKKGLGRDYNMSIMHLTKVQKIKIENVGKNITLN